MRGVNRRKPRRPSANSARTRHASRGFEFLAHFRILPLLVPHRGFLRANSGSLPRQCLAERSLVSTGDEFQRAKVCRRRSSRRLRFRAIHSGGFDDTQQCWHGPAHNRGLPTDRTEKDIVSQSTPGVGQPNTKVWSQLGRAVCGSIKMKVSETVHSLFGWRSSGLQVTAIPFFISCEAPLRRLRRLCLD
jgi:hypothetical protein